MRRILVTGAGGYIGSVLVPTLLDRGYRVLALDRFFFGRDTLPDHPGLTTIREDTRHLPAELLAGIHGIIDLAAVSNDPAGEEFSTATRAINHEARVRTAAMAREAGVKRYLLPSSCSVYGFRQEPVSEESPTNPLTEYARSNLAAERDILPLADSAFCVTVARQATVYGYSPRMRFDLAVNAMAHGAWEQGVIPVMRDGRQSRPMVHVRDVAEGLAHLLEQPASIVNGKTFNLGDADGNFTVRTLAECIGETVKSRTGQQPLLEWYGDSDHRSYAVDFGKIQRETGWKARHSLAAGVNEIIGHLEAGTLSRTKQTLTLEWYRWLEENPDKNQGLVLHGGLLRINTAGPADENVIESSGTASGADFGVVP